MTPDPEVTEPDEDPEDDLGAEVPDVREDEVSD